MATTCSGVLPGQYTASGAPPRRLRCRSTFAKPRSAYGRERSRSSAASGSIRPALTSPSRDFRLSLSMVRARETEEPVGAARLKAVEVEGDVHITEGAQTRHEDLVPAFLPQARHLLARDLHAREPLVMTHTEAAEAEGAHDLLRGVDLPQLVRGDAVAVLEPRRQAREGGLVPRGQAERLGEAADLRLGEPGVDHGRVYAALPRRLHAGPVIAEVVDIGAVHERAAPLALGDGRQVREERFLAEEAPVGAVLRVLRIRQLIRAHHHMPQPDEFGESPRFLELARRVRLGVRRDEHRPLAERVLGGTREERGVDPARERHHHALQIPQDLEEPLVLGVRRGIAGHASSAPARSASGVIGRAPTCAITSAAASAPRRPHVGRLRPRLRPSMKPAAYRSPAPVVSTTVSTACAATTWTSSPATMTEPRSLRVSAATSQCRRTCGTTASKSCVW